jgi:hypothetical protein
MKQKQIDTLGERSLIFRIIEYGISHDTFTVNELQKALALGDTELLFIFRTLWLVSDGRGMAATPNHVIVNRDGIGNFDFKGACFDVKCCLLPSALFSYVDYLEIKQARMAAQESKRLSWIAIAISIALGLLQVGFSR